MPTSANDTMSADARDSRRGRAAGALRGGLGKLGLVRRTGRVTGRGAIVLAVMLLALLVFLHTRTQDAVVKRHADIVAQLSAAKLIDAHWDVAVLRARTDDAPAQAVVQARDTNRIQRALDAAAAEAKSNAMRVMIGELKKAYAEKADLVARFQRASADSRQALEAAMRADAAVNNLVRGAWRDFPQRDRLIAAESLVARVLAEAQQYHHLPSAAHREALETFAADLPRAHSLPAAVTAGLSRLESDIHQLLLLKPLEHMLEGRLATLNTAARADALAETYQRDLSDALANRERYRIALLAYSGALLVLACWLGALAWQRYHALEARYVAHVRALAASGGDAIEETRPSEDLEAVDLEAGSSDVADANVRYFRRT